MADKVVKQTVVREYSLSWTEWLKFPHPHVVLSLTDTGVRVQQTA